MNTTERAGETRGEAARPRPARARRPDRPVQQNGCRASTGIDETSLSASFHAASLHKMLSPCPGESGCQRERVQGCAARNCPCAGHGAQNMRAQPGPACTSSIHVIMPVRALARTGEECSSAHVEGRTLRALRSGGGCSGLGLGVTLRKCGPREYLFDSCSGFIKVVQEQEGEQRRWEVLSFAAATTAPWTFRVEFAVPSARYSLCTVLPASHRKRERA